MAPPVELNTTLPPCSRAASSTWSVPTTLTSASKSGRSTDTRTSICAARWKQTSGWTSANRASASRRMSPTWSRAPSATFSRLPRDRSSSTWTSSPRASNASTTFEPMKPAPPVTIARTAPYRRADLFVTFEGVDGSGKTTQASLLVDALRADGRDVVATREPGGTLLGEEIRKLLLDRVEMSPWAETALFAAARAELVEGVIAPALDAGHTVVCDRYIDSSLAYQGLARGLGLERVLELNLAATGGLLPDRTFLIVVDPEVALQRGKPSDRIEREGEGFHRAVDEAYRSLAAMYPERITTVDGNRPADEVAEEIRGRVRELS